jgi:protein disulfide-isomerase
MVIRSQQRPFDLIAKKNIRRRKCMKYHIVTLMVSVVLAAGCSERKPDFPNVEVQPPAEQKVPAPAPVLVEPQPSEQAQNAEVKPVEPAKPSEPVKVTETKSDSGWQTDFAAAQKIAREKKLPILADFSGSDWCGWCIKLDKEVFSQDIFKNWAKDNVVLFLADFPRKNTQSEEIKKQNRALMDKYGVQGFPTVLILDAEGNMLQQTGYIKGGPQVYVDNLKVLLQKTP